MIITRLAIDLLLQTTQGAERLNAAVTQVELTLGDVARVIGYGVGDVVTGHTGHREDRDRTSGIEVHGFFIARGQLAVEVTGIAAI